MGLYDDVVKRARQFAEGALQLAEDARKTATGVGVGLMGFGALTGLPTTQAFSQVSQQAPKNDQQVLITYIKLYQFAVTEKDSTEKAAIIQDAEEHLEKYDSAGIIKRLLKRDYKTVSESRMSGSLLSANAFTYEAYLTEHLANNQIGTFCHKNGLTYNGIETNTPAANNAGTTPTPQNNVKQQTDPFEKAYNDKVMLYYQLYELQVISQDYLGTNIFMQNSPKQNGGGRIWKDLGTIVLGQADDVASRSNAPGVRNAIHWLQGRLNQSANNDEWVRTQRNQQQAYNQASAEGRLQQLLFQKQADILNQLMQPFPVSINTPEEVKKVAGAATEGYELATTVYPDFNFVNAKGAKLDYKQNKRDTKKGEKNNQYDRTQGKTGAVTPKESPEGAYANLTTEQKAFNKATYEAIAALGHGGDTFNLATDVVQHERSAERDAVLQEKLDGTFAKQMKRTAHLQNNGGRGGRC